MSLQSIKSQSIEPTDFAQARSTPRLMPHRVLLTAAAAAVLSLLAAGAQAGDAQEPGQDADARVTVRHKTVNYGDLDLSKQADAAALYSRLKVAARQVCKDHDTRGLLMWRAEYECSMEALSDAVADVGSSAVTALHAQNERVRVAQRRAEREQRT